MPQFMYVGDRAQVTLRYNGVGMSATGIALGPPRHDRFIVAFNFGESDAGGTAISATFNGSSVSMVTIASDPDPMMMAYGLVPTGTTVDVTLTISGAAAGRLFVYEITGLPNRGSVGFADGSYYNSTTQAITNATSSPANSVTLVFARSRGATTIDSVTGAVLNGQGAGTGGGAGNPRGGVASRLNQSASSSSIVTNAQTTGWSSLSYAYAVTFT